MIWSSTNGFVFIGNTASHMNSIISTPLQLVIFFATPKSKPMPMPRRPSIKSHSTNPFPAIVLNTDANGPFTPDKNPIVGDPPLIQALFPGVEKPSPNALSKKAQRKIKLNVMRRIAGRHTVFHFDICITVIRTVNKIYLMITHDTYCSKIFLISPISFSEYAWND